jgi:hemolysin activation/secretion protein
MAFDAKRYNALGDFVYLRASASWQHDLPAAAQIYGEVDGQVSNEPLISNEQFSAGGEGSVRGYLQSELLGDDGVHGTVELRTPPLALYLDKGGFALNDLRLFAFTDGAHGTLLDPLPGQQSIFDLASAGVGFHSTWLKLIHLDVDVGEPLITGVSTKRYQPRVDFRLYSNF